MGLILFGIIALAVIWLIIWLILPQEHRAGFNRVWFGTLKCGSPGGENPRELGFELLYGEAHDPL